MINETIFWLTIVGYGIGAAAHGAVRTVMAEGITLDGFAKTYFNHKQTPSWKIPKQIEGAFGIGKWGPLNASHYQTSHINCHLAATPGEISLEVQAGHSIKLQWSVWPTSHHGPILDYLANCNGECRDTDQTKLKFNKISEMGLIDTKLHKYRDEKQPTTQFASDKLIKDNNLWTVTIPSFVAPGNYVLRHETIALHNSWTPGGAQHIPQCINLKVTGSGTDQLLSGTIGTDLYSTSQPGLGVINIYNEPPKKYTIPGPSLYEPDLNVHSNTLNPSTTMYFSNSTLVATVKVTALSTHKATATSTPQATVPSTVALSVSSDTTRVVSTQSSPVVSGSKTSASAEPDSPTTSTDSTTRVNRIRKLVEKIIKLFGDLEGLLELKARNHARDVIL